MKRKLTRKEKGERLVKLYHLDTKCDIKFRGEDARAARRWLYDFLRSYPMVFAAFDGPKDPITMTFYTSSGFLVQDVLDLIFQRSGFEDVEMRVHYQCLSVLEDDLEHKGSFKFGRRKKGFLGFISPKDPNGQTHL